jgi:hypothetical protein
MEFDIEFEMETDKKFKNLRDVTQMVQVVVKWDCLFWMLFLQLGVQRLPLKRKNRSVSSTLPQ